jgi:hypothetical protein
MLIVNRGQSCARIYPGIDSNKKPASSTNKSDMTLFPSRLNFIASQVYHLPCFPSNAVAEEEKRTTGDLLKSYPILKTLAILHDF